MIQSRLNIIFTAFLFSSLVYLIVGFSLTRSGWQPILTATNLGVILFGVFLAISIVLIVVAIQLRSRLASQESNPQGVLSRSILLFALSEVPAILGLVLFLLTGKFLYLVLLCVLSILSFFLVRPR